MNRIVLAFLTLGLLAVGPAPLPMANTYSGLLLS
jgi:hypothetical protein